MKKLVLVAGAGSVAFALLGIQACSSSTSSTTTNTPMDSGEGPRVLACSPATDAGVAKAAEAGVTVHPKISSSTC